MKILKLIAAIAIIAIISTACDSVCVQCTYSVNNITNDSGERCVTSDRADEIQAEWETMAAAEGATASCTRY